MIASLRGEVAAIALDHAVVEVAGVGFAVLATPATLASLRVGAAARLATTLVVREDALTLFGFVDDDERDTFLAVQTVTGVGPRLALAILAVLSPEELRRAIAEEDLAALQRVSGIGRKVAQRLVLELAGRIGAPSGSAPAAEAADAAEPDQEVVAALASLGWTVKDATAAVAAVGDHGTRADTLRAALQHLAGASPAGASDHG